MRHVDPFSHPSSFYTCRSGTKNKWHFAPDPDDLRGIASRSARQLGHPVKIFKVLRGEEKTRPEGFLIVRRITGIYESGPKEIQWARVDTEEAAQTLRDVSCGPTPYFALTVAETLDPPN